MSQSFTPLVGTDTLTASRTTINNNLDALLSSFSGTSFPVSPVPGQHCLRTDEQKIYVCKSIGPAVWYLKVDLTKTMLTQEAADARYVRLDGNAALIPSGPTSGRPTVANIGDLRVNTETGKFEGYIAGWGSIGGGAFVGVTPPSNPQSGDFWFHSEDGILLVYYDDGNTAQWVDPSSALNLVGVMMGANNLSDVADATTARTNLGFEETPAKVYRFTNVAQVIIPWPTGALSVDFRGMLVPVVDTAVLAATISLDGGVTYLSTNYFNAYLYKSGTAVSGSGNGSSSSTMTLGLPANTVYKNHDLNARALQGSASRVFRMHALATGADGSGISQAWYHNLYNGFGAVTHVKLFFSSGNIESGALKVEGI